MQGRLFHGPSINPFAWVPCPVCNGEGGLPILLGVWCVLRADGRTLVRMPPRREMSGVLIGPTGVKG